VIGKQTGRSIEIMNSFELKFDWIEESIIIDQEYYKTKVEQCTTNLFVSKIRHDGGLFCAVKQVFSEMDFLGWYTTGDAPTDKDLEVHRQFVEYNESPVFLKLNPTASVGGDLPITVYESVIDLVGGEATMLFIDLPYTLATEEAERIGVDHVARMTASETGESSLGLC
jgi:COP9 signalosome complex subunit 6